MGAKREGILEDVQEGIKGLTVRICGSFMVFAEVVILEIIYRGSTDMADPRKRGDDRVGP